MNESFLMNEGVIHMEEVYLYRKTRLSHFRKHIFFFNFCFSLVYLVVLVLYECFSLIKLVQLRIA